MRSALGLVVTVTVASVGALGCFSLEAMTGPYIGCRPAEIRISDEAKVGDESTWTAICHHQSFQCRTARHGVECTADDPGPHLFTPRSLDDEAHPIARTPPPTGAAGFDFGAAIDAAAQQCSGAGKAWKELAAPLYECSGAPAGVGFAAVVRVEACGGKVCGVQVVADAGAASAADPVARFAELRTAFADKYGRVYGVTSTGMSGACAGPELRACFEDGRASAASRWTWRTGQTIEISLGKGSGRDPFALRLIYRGPQTPGAGPPKLDNL